MAFVELGAVRGVGEEGPVRAGGGGGEGDGGQGDYEEEQQHYMKI